MAVVLSDSELRDIFERLDKNTNDSQAIEDLTRCLKSVIKYTVQKFPCGMSEDIHQEILLLILKKREYLTKAFLSGRIKSPTNYFFRFLRNAAIVYLQKESRQQKHLVSIEDVKIENVISPKTYRRKKILIKIQQEVYSWLKRRFPEESDYKRASKYVDLILDGKRPNFNTKDVHAFYGGRQIFAKDAYSIVLQYVRKCVNKYIDDLVD